MSKTNIVRAKMNFHFRKHVAQSYQYTMALIRWRRLNFNETPMVFGNAMPKSGSKLLMQILQGFCGLGPFAYVDPAPVRTDTEQGRVRSAGEILADLRGMRPGIIRYGYLHATLENTSFLCKPGWVTFFIYRDPRDMLISHLFYATDMHAGHRMRKYYLGLPDISERLKVAIRGISEVGYYLADIRTRYERYLGWLGQTEMMSIRFEDLINDRSKTLAAMIDHFEKRGCPLPVRGEQAVHRLQKAIQPARSKTFRKGTSGGWREYFTEEHKRLFKEVAGDLLIRLGYESNNDW